MSSSRHPVALSIERRVSSSTRLLAVVMCLPLVDGVFVAVVLGGALSTAAGIIEVGLLIFGGSAMVAVILAEMDQGPREQARIVLAVGAVVIVGAAIQAALAPTVESILNMDVFERFAALVILAVAASTASSRLGDYLPGPGIIVLLGLIASLTPSTATLSVQTEPGLIVRAVIAASVGVAFALTVAVTSPWLRNAVEIDRFRFGSAVALGVLAFSVVGLIPENAPVALAVLAVTALLAFDPGRAREPEEVYEPDEIDITAAFSDGGNNESTEDMAGSQSPVDASNPSAEETPPFPDPRMGTDSATTQSETNNSEEQRPPWF